MAALPDLALLEVFRLLDMEQLLQVRAVCRRWRDQALEPAVWHHRRLLIDRHPKPRQRLLQETALRLAPCLLTLGVDLDARGPGTAALLRSLTETHCAAQELNLTLGDVPSITRILQHQVALGCLSKVGLTFHYKPDPEDVFTFRIKPKEMDGLAELLRALASSGIIEELSIHNLDRFDESVLSGTVRKAVDSCSGAAVAASLKRLLFHPFYVLSAIPAFLVRAHAASLEEICLPISDLVDSQPLFSDFPALPNLRRLKCLILMDMTQLLGSPHLQSLHVYFNDQVKNHPSCLATAAHFFRRATQLRSLVLESEDDKIMSNPALQDVVSAIGASGESAIESLSLLFGQFGQICRNVEEVAVTALPRSVVSTLPGLPHLRTLRLQWAYCPFGLLSSLLAAAGAHPCLEMLHLDACRAVDQDECAHAFSHRAEVQRALRSNPRLHLQLNLGGLGFHWCHRRGPDGNCAACDAGCHPELVGALELGMYSHPDSQTCSLHEGLYCDAPWVRLDQDQPLQQRSESCGDGH